MVSLLGNVQPFTPLEEGRAVASREDEIDLVGVGVALVRIWQLVVGVFVPSGVIVALLKKPEYAYSAGGGQLAAYATISGNTAQVAASLAPRNPCCKEA